ncbi:TPA: hypothetical protein EYP44_03020 [Candidatus Bathyarchaeota archaeon]|nr:hypothetical protein [Candidatus Bathyarchaeota archaeon]
MIFPVVLGVRGAVNGVLSGRLTTGLHTGLVEASLRGNTRYYRMLLSSVFALSLVSSATIGLIVFSIGNVFYGVPLGDLPFIIYACVTINALAVFITAPITSLLGFLSYRRGMDPDIFVYPASSTVADILATVCYVITLSLVFWWGPAGRIAIALVSYGFCFIALLLTVLFGKEREYWRTIREALMAVFAVGIIEGLSGAVLSGVKAYIERYPSILVIYPALIDTVGDAGSIFGSLSTTRLALGTLDARMGAIKGGLGELLQVEIAALMMYAIYSGIAFIGEGSEACALAIILVYLIATLPIILASFSMAILTFTRGLDPDNFVIPIEMAFADSLVTSVLAMLVYLRVV